MLLQRSRHCGENYWLLILEREAQGTRLKGIHRIGI
jgi:hypothetical protein